jgi:hypothetical protein
MALALALQASIQSAAWAPGNVTDHGRALLQHEFQRTGSFCLGGHLAPLTFLLGCQRCGTNSLYEGKRRAALSATFQPQCNPRCSQTSSEACAARGQGTRFAANPPSTAASSTSSPPTLGRRVRPTTSTTSPTVPATRQAPPCPSVRRLWCHRMLGGSGGGGAVVERYWALGASRKVPAAP